ncbi:hypothetical protein OS493_033911 [Desmophyllum pertusum]|uniref:Uncharacterized protein n=1 Tax=Desmophyllum pertusum TaxID=174260 RepID=A0A9X0D6C6_9CNID|nr:hypothetical protein OS493_033911 [Desmophyllum pertusum]
MADEESIRRCVRGRLELNLVQRTRNLIRSAAFQTSRDLNQNVGRGSLKNRSRSCSPAFRSTSASSTAPVRRRIAQDLPILVALKDPTQLPATLGGLRKQRGNGKKDATLTTSSQLSQGSASTSFSRIPSHASASATVRLSDVPHLPPVSDDSPAVSDDDDLPEFGAAQSMPTTEQKVARLAADFLLYPACHKKCSLSLGSTERAVNSLLTYRSY